MDLLTLIGFNWLHWWQGARIILWMLPANERRCHNVTSSLIGWAHSQNDPWECLLWCEHFGENCLFHNRITQYYHVTENKMLSIWHCLIGGTISCHYDNLRCYQWRQCCKIDNFLFSVVTVWFGVKTTWIVGANFHQCCYRAILFSLFFRNLKENHYSAKPYFISILTAQQFFITSQMCDLNKSSVHFNIHIMYNVHYFHHHLSLLIGVTYWAPAYIDFWELFHLLLEKTLPWSGTTQTGKQTGTEK